MIQTRERAEACLLLEDGRRFDGFFLGERGEALGEVVFNTAMTGYQEILTDPSYTGQLVTMTYPLIGNYGVNDADQESRRPAAAGFVVREAARAHSSWRATAGLEEYLARNGVVGIQSVDTRAVTRHIRAAGAMRGAIAAAHTDEKALMARIHAHPRMEGLDLAGGVSTAERYVVAPPGRSRFRVFAYDLGVKANSPRLLAERGCEVTVLPADTPAGEIARERPDGLFVSNGPGDPAAVEMAIETIRDCAHAGVPVFGICLGHQLIARAFGAETFKLPFGHHGAKPPGAQPGPGHGGDHIPESRLRGPGRGRRRDPGRARTAPHPRQPVRRDRGGHGPPLAPGVLRAVSSRGRARPPRQPLPV